ncbi:MAG: hypothetical protein WC393_01340 [Candidatus Nanoarchaeia archaeon]|jgi:PBP1b-binding outer membrane lipoprotein LpoB
MKNIVSFSLFLIVLLSGCTTNYNYEQDEPAMPINDYFGQEVLSYAYKVVNSTFDCLNGSCPNAEISSNGVTVDCTFCAANNTGIIGDKLRVRMGVSGFSDLAGKCALNVVKNEINGLFDIISMNETTIIAKVIRTGNVKHSGVNCTDSYEYNYENVENWIFNNE